PWRTDCDARRRPVRAVADRALSRLLRRQLHGKAADGAGDPQAGRGLRGNPAPPIEAPCCGSQSDYGTRRAPTGLALKANATCGRTRVPRRSAGVVFSPPPLSCAWIVALLVGGSCGAAVGQDLPD